MKDDAAEGIDLPAFHPSITESDEHGRAKNKLRLKAAQVHTLMRISEDLMSPLLGDYDDEDGVWQSWLAHVEYFLCMTASSFTTASIKQLDAKIQHHQELYSKVHAHHHCALISPNPLSRTQIHHLVSIHSLAGAGRSLRAQAPLCAPRSL